MSAACRSSSQDASLGLFSLLAVMVSQVKGHGSIAS